MKGPLSYMQGSWGPNGHIAAFQHACTPSYGAIVGAGCSACACMPAVLPERQHLYWNSQQTGRNLWHSCRQGKGGVRELRVHDLSNALSAQAARWWWRSSWTARRPPSLRSSTGTPACRWHPHRRAPHDGLLNVVVSMFSYPAHLALASLQDEQPSKRCGPLHLLCSEPYSSADVADSVMCSSSCRITRLLVRATLGPIQAAWARTHQLQWSRHRLKHRCSSLPELRRRL